jgi:lysozyme
MASSTLREFVVKLGFKLEESQYRRFKETMESLGKSTIELSKAFLAFGEAALAAGTVATAAVAKMAQPLEALYYASQRTKASAQGLDAWRFAAEKVGVSAEAAQAQIESLAALRRDNPGTNEYLKNLLGLKDVAELDKMPTEVIAMKALQALQNRPKLRGIQESQTWLGWSEDTFVAESNNLPDFQKGIAGRNKQINDSGVDMAKSAKDARDFDNAVKDLTGDLDLMKTRMLEAFFPGGDKFINDLDKVVNDFISWDKASGGLLSKTADLAIAVTALSTAVNILGTATGAFSLIKWLRGAGIAGGAAAGEAGAAAGGVGLATILGPAAVGLGLGIGAQALDDKYGTGIRASMGLTDDPAENRRRILNWITGKPNDTANDGMPDLSKWISGFEGFRSRVYKDGAGFDTIGFGHKVLPGEDFSNGIDEARGISLRGQDIATAVQAVRNMVKVHLNGGQMQALSDMVYHFGARAIGSSKLMRDLNVGDFAGAAAQFDRWSRAGGHFDQGVYHRSMADKSLFLKGHSVHQDINIHVDGGKDPAATGAEVAKQQKSVNSDLVRNLAGAYR